MSNPTSIAAPFEPVGAKRLLDQFVVSQAAELARSGSYTSAESLIKDLVLRADAPPDAIDLMARICVQQGRMLEAGGLWRRALERDPTNTAYQAALVRLNRVQRRPVWLNILWPAVLALAVAVTGLAAMRIQSRRHRVELARLEGQIAQASDSAAKTADLGRLSESVSDLKTQQRDLRRQLEQANSELQGLAAMSANIAKTSNNLLAAWARQESAAYPSDSRGEDTRRALGTSPAVGAPPFRLDIPIAGITAIPQEDHWIIRFDQRLFDRDDHFKAGSEAMLEAVAKKLVQSQEKIGIEVISTAGDEAGNQGLNQPEARQALPLARVEKVKQFLSGLGIFPDAALRIAVRELHGSSDRSDRVRNDAVAGGVFLQVSRFHEE